MARNAAQWQTEIARDIGVITTLMHHLQDHADTPEASLSVMLKEARWLESDIRRYARDVYGIRELEAAR